VFDPQRVVAFPNLSLASGAIKGWDRRNAFTHAILRALAEHYDFSIDTPFEDLNEAIQNRVLYGSGSDEIAFSYLNDKGQTLVRHHPFEGIIPNLERRWRETDSNAVREELNNYRHTCPCPACGGTRLREEARNVLIGNEAGPNQRRGRAIYEVEALSLADCLDWFEKLELSGAKLTIATRLLHEITARLAFLNNVGLGYLSLDRSANTISGGEAQR